MGKDHAFDTALAKVDLPDPLSCCFIDLECIGKAVCEWAYEWTAWYFNQNYEIVVIAQLRWTKGIPIPEPQLVKLATDLNKAVRDNNLKIYQHGNAKPDYTRFVHLITNYLPKTEVRCKFELVEPQLDIFKNLVYPEPAIQDDMNATLHSPCRAQAILAALFGCIEGSEQYDSRICWPASLGEFLEQHPLPNGETDYSKSVDDTVNIANTLLVLRKIKAMGALDFVSELDDEHVMHLV